ARPGDDHVSLGERIRGALPRRYRLARGRKRVRRGGLPRAWRRTFCVRVHAGALPRALAVRGSPSRSAGRHPRPGVADRRRGRRAGSRGAHGGAAPPVRRAVQAGAHAVTNRTRRLSRRAFHHWTDSSCRGERRGIPMSDRRPHAATRAVRAGIATDTQHGAVVPPIHLSSTFAFDGFEGKREYDYTRSGNPTRSQLADALAELEQGATAVVTSTGMSAVAL